MPHVCTRLIHDAIGERLADQYLDVIATTWRRRSGVLQSPSLNLSDLAGVDDRIFAALDALCSLGKHAKLCATRRLEDPVQSGEMFALCLYAVATQDRALWNVCDALSIALPELRAPLITSLEWAPVNAMFERVIEALPAPERLHVSALRYVDMRDAPPRTLQWLKSLSPSIEDIVAGLEFVRRIGASDLAASALPFLVHEDEGVRLAAAQTACVLSVSASPTVVAATLETLHQSKHPQIKSTAMRCAVLHGITGAFERVQRELSTGEDPALCLAALGWSGRPEAVSMLKPYLSDNDHSRIAGAALMQITGSHPDRDGWGRAAPLSPLPQKDVGDAIAPLKPDTELPWPDDRAFARWWSRQANRFRSGERYLLGHPMATRGVCHAIKEGALRWRSMAAEHLQRLTRGPLMPSQLAAPFQYARISTQLPREAQCK